MTTLEMMNEAEKTCKTYKCDDNIIRYSNQLKFYDTSSNNKPLESYHFNTINNFMNIDTWEEVKSKLMTIEQVENELGYEVTIINCGNCLFDSSICCMFDSSICNKCENYNKHSLRED